MILGDVEGIEIAPAEEGQRSGGADANRGGIRRALRVRERGGRFPHRVSRRRRRGRGARPARLAGSPRARPTRTRPESGREATASGTEPQASPMARRPSAKSNRPRRNAQRTYRLAPQSGPALHQRPAEGRPGNHRPDRQGAARPEGRAHHLAHRAARPLPGVHADASNTSASRARFRATKSACA